MAEDPKVTPIKSTSPAAKTKPPATLNEAPKAEPPAKSKEAQQEARVEALSTARMRRRHVFVMLSFLALVLVPSGAWYWYLQQRAADQYASHVAFSVRSAETSPAVELFGGISTLAGGSASVDTDILYQYIHSQNMVALLDQQLDLRTRFSKPDDDFVFSFNPSGSIEDLTRYWRRMVKMTYDPGVGLIEVRVTAFTAEDARLIAQALLDESSRAINNLSDIARRDATRYAQEDLETAVGRLREARQTIAEFRNRHRLIDPTLDVQAQMQIITALEEQKTDALIEMDLLRGTTTRPDDQRINQIERRLEVINARINDERRRMGAGLSSLPDADDETTSSVLGEFEGLSVDREFAEQSYLTALAAFDQAQAEARRQSRYVAPHIRPSIAERSVYPKRTILWATATAILLILWAIAVLIYYAIRERR